MSYNSRNQLSSFPHSKENFNLSRDRFRLSSMAQSKENFNNMQKQEKLRPLSSEKLDSSRLYNFSKNTNSVALLQKNNVLKSASNIAPVVNHTAIEALK
jgi:hypothetical protein